MPYFDRFDICEAYAVFEWGWNLNGWLQERKSNQRRLESTGTQLARMDFVPAPNLSYETLTENGREIYDNLERRYGLFEDGTKYDVNGY